MNTGRESQRSSWLNAPIAGVRKLIGTPTSSDVHLYKDPETIDTDRPILFADCEGLSGGNNNPMSAIAGGTIKLAR